MGHSKLSLGHIEFCFIFFSANNTCDIPPRCKESEGRLKMVHGTTIDLFLSLSLSLSPYILERRMSHSSDYFYSGRRTPETRQTNASLPRPIPASSAPIFPSSSVSVSSSALSTEQRPSPLSSLLCPSSVHRQSVSPRTLLH